MEDDFRLSMKGPFFVPTKSVADWLTGLSSPSRQAVKGKSAETLARTWEEADGIPDEVKQVLSKVFGSTELLWAFPEYTLRVPQSGHQPQTDLMAVLNTEQGCVVVAVEGKVSEAFGSGTVGDSLDGTSEGRSARARFYAEKLGIQKDILRSVRIQLVERAFCALRVAEALGSKHAVMLVHSFSPKQAQFTHYEAFVRAFGVSAPVKAGECIAVAEPAGVALYAAWVNGA